MELCGWQRAKYINNICVAFAALFHYNNLCPTYTNKDQVLKPQYTALSHIHVLVNYSCV